MTEKRVVKSNCFYDNNTNEIKCDVELNDGTRHSFAAAVIADASSTSNKMYKSKKPDDSDESVEENSSHV